MKKLIITEEEKKHILQRHKSHGYKPNEGLEEDSENMEDTQSNFDDLLDIDSELEMDRDSLEQS